LVLLSTYRGPRSRFSDSRFAATSWRTPCFRSGSNWWEHGLHNQSALGLKGRPLLEPGVMVTSVPWQLSSLEWLKTLQPQNAPGDAPRRFFD
jgi:hypothetical protein